MALYAHGTRVRAAHVAHFDPSGRALKGKVFGLMFPVVLHIICYEGNQPTIFVRYKLLLHASGNDYMCQLAWLPEPRINRCDTSGFLIESIYYSTWGQWNILSDFQWPSLTKRVVKHHLHMPINLSFQSDMTTFHQGTRSHLLTCLNP